MPWDIPDEGGSKGPEEPDEGMQTKRLWASCNLETGEQHLLESEDKVDPDTGKLNKFFRIIGRTGDAN